MSDTTNTTTVSPVFSITPETVTQLLTYLQQGQAVAVAELQQIQPLNLPAQPTPEDIIKLQQQKEVIVGRLSKVKLVYDKMLAKRKAFTDPIKEKISQIMSFENAIDYNKDNNEYAKARKIIEDFDQAILEYTKREKEKAELEKRKTQYKADLRAAVERRLLEMMTGQEKTTTTMMINWESGLTLENIAQKESTLKAAKLELKKEKYDECFNTNFTMNTHLLSAEDTKLFIEALKTSLTYEHYNEQYLQMAGPIKNEYLAKIPSVKEKLEKIKGNAEAEKKRKADLATQQTEALASIDKQAEVKAEDIENKKDLAHMESEFVQQGTTGELPSQASKKVASFENDAMWLQPLLLVISHVAINGSVKIKNAKGEYAPEIAKWLKAFESCHGGKVIPGLKMEDEAKTTIRAKS
jgi:hypothetical protein